MIPNPYLEHCGLLVRRAVTGAVLGPKRTAREGAVCSRGRSHLSPASSDTLYGTSEPTARRRREGVERSVWADAVTRKPGGRHVPQPKIGIQDSQDPTTK